MPQHKLIGLSKISLFKFSPGKENPIEHVTDFPIYDVVGPYLSADNIEDAIKEAYKNTLKRIFSPTYSERDVSHYFEEIGTEDGDAVVSFYVDYHNGSECFYAVDLIIDEV